MQPPVPPPPSGPWGPPPPPGPWGPPPPRRSTALWWILGGALVLVIALVTGLFLVNQQSETAGPTTTATATATSGVTTSTTPTAAGPNISVAIYSPEALLLSADAIGAVMDAGLTGGPVMKLAASDGGVDPAHCTGTYGPGTARAYQDSDYTALAGQIMRDNTTPATVEVVQVALSFPEPDDATEFVAEQSDEWAACASVQASVQYPDGTVTSSTIGQSSTADEIVRVTITPDPPLGPRSLQCQRALAAVHNAVVDVRACASSIGEQAVELVKQMRQQVP